MVLTVAGMERLDLALTYTIQVQAELDSLDPRPVYLFAIKGTGVGKEWCRPV